MTLEEIKNKIEQLQAERRILFDKKKPIDDRLLSSYDEIENLEDERDTLVLAQNPSMDWKQLFEMNKDASTVAHKHLSNRLQEEFGMMRGGVWTATGEVAVSLVVDKTNESVKKAVAGIETLMKVLQPHEDGYIWFKILENTCGEYGSYKLMAKPGEFVLTITSYGTPRKIESFDTAIAAVKYIQKHHLVS